MLLIFSFIFWFFLILAGIYCFFLFILSINISTKESFIIEMFLKRSDSIPAIYEASKNFIGKPEDIFREILELRATEFWLRSVSKNFEVFGEIEKKIHHEMNFVFQVCNKNVSLLKSKEFLYLRDIIMNQSSEISKKMKQIKKMIEIYNNFLKYKNFSLIWFFIPLHKKESL